MGLVAPFPDVIEAFAVDCELWSLVAPVAEWTVCLFVCHDWPSGLDSAEICGDSGFVDSSENRGCPTVAGH